MPFGMFYVEVDPDSTAEKILAIAAMAPYFIMCALTTLIVRCRELLAPATSGAKRHAALALDCATARRTPT